MPLESYKSFGLLSFLVAFLGVALMLMISPKEAGKSISKHAAKSRFNLLFMFVIESVGLSLFLLFILRWFAPTFAMPALFRIACIYIVSGFIIASLVPATEGLQNAVHEWLAYSAAFLLVLPLILISLSDAVSLAPRYFAGYSAGRMLYMVYLLFFKPAAKKRHLIYQSEYLLLFALSILLATYVR